MDALAFEVQFLDHLAPVWRAMDAQHRGTFLVDDTLVDHAAALGVEATGRPGHTVRIPATPPKAKVEPGPQALVASYGDMKVARRLGYRRFAFIEHGIGQSYAGVRGSGNHGSYAGGEDRDDVELFLMPNQHSADRWSAAYPNADVRVVGSPRLDALPGRDWFAAGDDPVVAVAFHWNASHIASEAGTTWADYRDVLPEVARAYRTIGHGHPRIIDRLSDHYRRMGIKVVRSFDEVCRRADVYVCDNSSTMFEFASTGRPVVTLNGRMYRKHVNHGLRFWEAADVGVQVDHAADLIPSIAYALMDPPEAAANREKALGVVYAYRTGAAARVAAIVANWDRAMVAA